MSEATERSGEGRERFRRRVHVGELFDMLDRTARESSGARDGRGGCVEKVPPCRRIGITRRLRLVVRAVAFQAGAVGRVRGAVPVDQREDGIGLDTVGEPEGRSQTSGSGQGGSSSGEDGANERSLP
jgi:hypothetical protein